MSWKPPKPAPASPDAQSGTDDTAHRHLSRDERARLGMDSWEPSLLRRLLKAQNKLGKTRKQ